MTSASDRTLNRIAAVGLLVGAGFGLAGTLVTSPNLQASLWAIDSVALVIATSLLTLKYFRAESELVSAGFLVFAIGEGVLLSGTAAGPRGSVPAFAAGIALWTAALALISAPARLPGWLRLLGGRRRLFVRDHGRPDLCGRGAVADLGTAAVLGLPVPRGDLARMGVDAAARGGIGPEPYVPPGKSGLAPGVPRPPVA